MPGTLRPPVLLWSIQATGPTATNERVAGITGVNPVQLKPYYTGAVISVAVLGKFDYILTRVAVLGSMDGTRFGPPGLDDAIFTMTRDLIPGQAVARAVSIFSNPTIIPGTPTAS